MPPTPYLNSSRSYGSILDISLTDQWFPDPSSIEVLDHLDSDHLHELITIPCDFEFALELLRPISIKVADSRLDWTNWTRDARRLCGELLHSQMNTTEELDSLWTRLVTELQQLALNNSQPQQLRPRARVPLGRSFGEAA